MDVKKKLVELLRPWLAHLSLAAANDLIANGVTVADGKDTDVPTKWITASEPPKEPGEYIVAQKHWSDGHLETKKGKWNGVEWLVDGRESLMVTHWMPPSPPAGTAERRMRMSRNVKCINCVNLKDDWCEKVIDSPYPDLERNCRHFQQKTNADQGYE